MNGFLLGILFVGELALVGVVGWSIWYHGRRDQDIRRRVDEALDDDDLIDFQTRVQTLLEEVRSSSDSMIEAIERRQAALDRSLAKVRDAEKRLAARSSSLERAAKKAEDRLDRVPVKAVPQPKNKREKTMPSKVEQRPITALPVPPPVAQPQIIAPAETPNRYQQIYELADKGISREQISRQTGILAGEIDLILNLRPADKRKSGIGKA